MVSEYMARDPARPRGMWSPRDRKYLLDKLDVMPQSQKEREIRADLRERMWNCLLDFQLLYDHVEDRDIQQAIGSPDTSNQELWRDAGIVRVLALIFDISTEQGAIDTRQFERYLKDAIKASERRQRFQFPEEANSAVWLSDPDVTVNVNLPETIDIETLAAKVKAIEERGIEAADNNEDWLSGDVIEGYDLIKTGEELGLDSLSPAEVLFLYYTRAEKGDGARSISRVLEAWNKWHWAAGRHTEVSWLGGGHRIGSWSMFSDETDEE